MKICRVLGTVVATAKHPAYVGHKLLVVQPEDEHGEPVGASYLAVDVVQAGAGDRVLVMSEGTGVRQILKQQILPIRSLIVGIVDAVDTVTEKPAARGRGARRTAGKT
jgi:ethanolamine utilization protein EutN